MEGNKDEALRCIALGKQYMQDGKLDKAEKFLNKAQKLFKTDQAQELLDKLKTMPKTQKTSPSASPSRNRAASGNQKAEEQPINYTQEQVDAVKRINKCKDFYEILGVKKDTTDSEIKKAYKKLALQVHPDKNKAPGSVEAFKALGNAVAILTDAEKRKRYDLYGDESTQERSGSRYQQQQFGYGRSFEADITPEEIFNLFFNGGYPNQNVYMRQRRFNRNTDDHRREQGNQQPQTGYGALINLLPIIILITLSMMSSFFISEPIYSLQPSLKYSVSRTTHSLKVPYYVKENFHSEYSGSVGRLEATVEEDYLQNLKHSCYRERNYKEASLMKARNLGDRQLYDKAKSLPTPSCDTLYRFQN